MTRIDTAANARGAIRVHPRLVVRVIRAHAFRFPVAMAAWRDGAAALTRIRCGRMMKFDSDPIYLRSAALRTAVITTCPAWKTGDSG